MMKKRVLGRGSCPARGGAGGPRSLSIWAMVDGVGGNAKAPLPPAGNGTQRDLATPPFFSSPPPPARSKEPFIILHIRTDTMVGLWGRGLGVWSLSSANKTLPEDEERIRK